jgi:hypothetical protein
MFIVSLNAKLKVAGGIHISCNNFMAVVEMMGVRFLHHVLKFCQILSNLNHTTHNFSSTTSLKHPPGPVQSPYTCWQYVPAK